MALAAKNPPAHRLLHRDSLFPTHCGPKNLVQVAVYFSQHPDKAFSLETAVGRPPGCVPRGVRQGATRRNSGPIPTSCNTAGRRTVRALAVVAPLTQLVSLQGAPNWPTMSHLHALRSGQLPFLGSDLGNRIPGSSPEVGPDQGERLKQPGQEHRPEIAGRRTRFGADAVGDEIASAGKPEASATSRS